MAYCIRKIEAAPDFDAIEVIKLRCDKSVLINERIFAQAQIGRNEELFFARIWSFEPQLPQCVLSIVMENEDKSVIIKSSAAGGQASFIVNGVSDSEITAYLFSGEDLQGIYNGVVMMVPINKVLNGLGLSEQLLPAVVKGNIVREGQSVSAAAVNKEDRIEFEIMQ